MGDLTVGLAIVGGVALAAVVAHGAWQARRAGPRRAAPAGETPSAAQIEPVLGASAAPAADHEVVLARPGLRRTNPRLDALIDAIATLRPEAPLAAEFVLAHLPPTRRAGSKPFLIEGLNAETGEWEAIALGAHYGELQAGVQMANRTGALNEIEYSEFVQRVQAFADAIGAMSELPDMLDVVARARELDAFAGEHDAQLALHLQARSAAWSVGYIQQHAARQGFVVGAVPGRMVLPAAEEGGPPVLVLGFDAQAALADDPNLAAVRDVTLSFDVAQTDPARQPFAAWQTSAQALASSMEASIVDDQGRALGDAGFASIAIELERLYATLATHDFAAGSAAARRLFS
jgi:hypothetical protein